MGSTRFESQRRAVVRVTARHRCHAARTPWPTHPANVSGNRLSSKNRSDSMHSRTLLAVASAACLATGAVVAQSVDTAAAESLMKRSNCLTCHAVDKKKVGPAFKETAAKYKGKPDAEQKLYTHLTTSPMVKLDGNEMRHDSLKTKNEAEIKNVIAYIVSR
jgi:cytochrome c